MEIQTSKQDVDLAAMKIDLAVIKSNYMTRSDFEEEIGKQTKWFTASLIATAGICLALARWMF
jgi:hypothetical protein